MPQNSMFPFGPWSKLARRVGKQWLRLRQRSHQFRLVAQWYLRSSAPYRPLLVLATHRCGSNLLLSYLDHLPGVRCASEVLCETLPYGLSKRQSQPHLALRHIRRSLHALPGNVRGCKLMLDQLQRCGLTACHLAEAFPTACYIVLYRQSLLEQFVSFETARTTQQWYLYDGQQPRHARVWVDPARFRAYCEEIRTRYEALLASQQLQTCSVVLSYEELAAHPEICLRERICPLLQVPYAPPQTRLRKQNTLPLPQRVVNYAQIAGLQAAPWCWQHYELSDGRQRLRTAA